MIPLTEIKRELLAVLKDLYPKGYMFYGIEITEGYKKPSFFVQLVPVSSEVQTKRVKSRVFIFAITYFQKKIDEEDALRKVSEIENAYGNKVKIGTRYANVTDFEYEYVGEYNNILQARVTFSFNDLIDQSEEEHDLVEEVHLKKEMEE